MPQCEPCGKYYEDGPVIEFTIEDSELTWELNLCDICWGEVVSHYKVEGHAANA